MNLISGNAGESMIACVDADYDYLLQGSTSMSRTINHNPYVFHTYAYAIENLQCCAESLHNVCVAVTLNDKPIFDFREYLRLYSEAIFPCSCGAYGSTGKEFTESSPSPISTMP